MACIFMKLGGHHRIHPAAVSQPLLLPPAAAQHPVQPVTIRTLPPQLASLRSLQVLTVSQNVLIRDEVPQGLGELKNLVHLNLNYNSLTGTIPSRIGEL
ncbi:hypothetical protein E2562_028258 [Oryza meyeriana var. granulata]|uniref:Leucine-rich repeat-containing N-terminal plant-type domain-containing protein n=1 Tax=Oryza meyeriana var. granulata TaxID=110450 RepID=A0A6G1DP36_9ORYZ|nr:hypothetical protein E2562_028258 [Oryza meyeriana var. granulata]